MTEVYCVIEGRTNMPCKTGNQACFDCNEQVKMQQSRVKQPDVEVIPKEISPPPASVPSTNVPAE
jgi:hypothetical protein